MNEQAIQFNDDIFIERFVDALGSRSLANQTVRSYKADVVKFLKHLKSFNEQPSQTLLRALKPEDFESYLNALLTTGSKISSIKRTIVSLREYFEFLCSIGVVESNKVNTIKITSVYRRVLSQEQILALYNYLFTRQQLNDTNIVTRYIRDEIILTLMLFHGVRQYQIPSVKLSTVDRRDSVVTMTIGARTVVQLSKSVIPRLSHYLALRKSTLDTIFIDHLTGKPISEAVIHSFLHELSYTLHILCTPVLLHQTYVNLSSTHGQMSHLIKLINEAQKMVHAMKEQQHG